VIFLNRVIPGFMAFFFCSSILADNSKPEITNVEPSLIKIRHSADVLIDVKNTNKDTQLSISPGGTYLITNTGIPSNAKNMAISERIFLLQEKDAEITALEKSFTGKFQSFHSIEIKTDIKHIASKNDLFIIADNSNTLHSYDTENEIKHLKSQKFSGNISAISVSTTHICAIVDQQIVLLNQSTLETLSISAEQTTDLNHIAAKQDKCLSVNKNQNLQLWQNINGNLNIISEFTPNNQINNLIVNEQLAVIANGATGVSLLSLEDDKIKWLGSYNKLGNITHVTISGNDLLAADDQGVLTLFDVSQPETPLLISDFKLHKTVDKLAFIHNQAYVISDSKLFNIDFSAKSPPIISTLGVNQGGSRRSTIVDSILYVADWFSGMHIYDISIPNAPRLLSSFHTPGSPKGVVVKNNVAFVADDDHGLQVVDVSNPLRPEFISSIPLSGLAYTMKLIDDLLYIASHRGGFHILDVSNVKNLKLLATYDTPSKSWALEYKQGLLYVADDSTGLMVFDVNDPTNPVLINQFNPNGLAEDVILIGNTAYVAFFDLGLFVLDITDPLNIKQIAHLPTPGNARGIEIHDDLLYLASWEAGVLIIDIKEPAHPKIIGQYDTKGATWGLSVKNKMIYAMDWWGGVKIINAEDSTAPILIGEYQTAGKIEDVLFHDRFIYTAHGSRGLQIYETSNSLNPVWATGKDINGNAKSLTINNQLALIAGGDGGLIIVDIKNPFQTHWLSQLKLDSSADFITSTNSQVFIAENNGDFYQIDISQAKNPRLIKRINANVQDMQLHNQSLYVLSDSQTLDVYDVKNASSLKHQKRIPLSAATSKIRIKDTHIFLVHPNKGLSAYVMEKNKLIELASYKTDKKIHDVHIDNNSLYATTDLNELLVFHNSSDNPLQLATTYPTVHQLEQITTSKDGIFFSGENIIASGKLLPKVNIKRSTKQFIVQVPDNMPAGAYHVSANNGQQQDTRINAFKVGFPKLKSKFTLEDLKKKMQQKNFDGKAPE